MGVLVGSLPARGTAQSGSRAKQTAKTRAVQLSTAFNAAAERILPSVVTIQAVIPQAHRHPFRLPSTNYAVGSGVVFSRDGAIVTNHHVVEDGRHIEVFLRDGRVLPATVVGTDPASDLAVLRVEAKGLVPARFADSDHVRIGQWALALGAPLGLTYSLTAGIISARGRQLGKNEIEDYLQTDASINHGNSGGALVNLEGDVVGINTLGVSADVGSGLNFAIPSNMARRVAEAILRDGEVRRPWIGATFQTLTPGLARGFGVPGARGALVDDVRPAGPALAAGLRPGDIVQRVGKTPVKHTRELLRVLLDRRPGSQVTLGVLRAGKHLSLSMTTATRPRPKQEERSRLAATGAGAAKDFGMTVGVVTGALARKLSYRGKGKLVVTTVARGGGAERAGVARGDLIIEADGQPVSKLPQLKAAMADGAVLLRIERAGGAKYLMLDRR